MDRRTVRPITLLRAAGFTALAAGLYLTSHYNYLLFHGLVEVFSIAVATGVFMIAWNARRMIDNHYLLLVGIAMLFVAGIDLLHTLAFRGMGVFEHGGVNLPTQLWVAARYVQAISFLIAPLFLGRALNARLALAAYGAGCGLLLAAIFGGLFPAAYAEGVGQTAFKLISEYIICVLLLVGAAMLLRHRRSFDRRVLDLLLGSLGLTVVSELMFTLYTDPYGPANLLGHLLKIASYYLLYKALVQTGLQRPYGVLFTNLQQNQQALRENVQRLGLLSQTASVLLRPGRPTDLIAELLRPLSAQLGLDVYLLYLAHDREQALRLECHGGVPPEALAGLAQLRMGEGISGTAAQERKPVVVEDVQRPAADPRAHLVHPLGVQCFAAYPLLTGDRLMGTLAFGSRTRRRLREEELGLLHIIADQTAVAIDRWRLVEELQQRADQLAAANRAKDEFLATVSHELRTPLTAIMGWSRLLQGGQVDAETLREGLDTIERNARAQARLVEDLLDVSRIISGKLRLTIRPIDLGEVLEAAINTVRPAADAKQIDLRVSIDRSVCRVHGDPDRLQQVAWNLLSNAIKFTDPRGRVEALLDCDDARARLTIRDTGRGISPDFLPLVFEPFRQADTSSTRRHGGLGLGLAIVRHLVELHGGQIRAHSDGEGQGATFTVLLPIPASQASAPFPAGPGDAAQVPECRPALAGLRILAVDDQADARQLIRAVLERCGAEVMTAASAAEAWEAFQPGRARPDLLISDIGMPDRDGYWLIEQVRAQEAQARLAAIPAAALTAYTRLEDRMRALAAGYQMYLPKPIEPAELVTVVANLAGRLPQPASSRP